LLIYAGAGMSAESGLEVFHGSDSLQQSLLLYKDLVDDYKEVITQKFLDKYPNKWWYFYGKRYEKYSRAKAHKGYQILRDICGKYFTEGRNFVNTSNVDELFLKSDFSPDCVWESRGNIFNM
jgi:NAD-dependent SIR2 family protein deacetylase